MQEIGALGKKGRPAVKAGPFGSSLRKDSFVASGYRVYGQEQVIAGCLDIGTYYIDEHKFQSLKSCEIQEGDLLLSLVGTIGKVLVVPPDAQPGIINPRLLRLSLNKEIIIPEFAKIYLESQNVTRLLASWAQGGTMGVLNAGIVSQLPIPLVPIREQRAIVRTVSYWDHAIDLTERLIAAKEEHMKWLMQQLLTGKRRLKGYKKAWQEVHIRDLFKPVKRKNDKGVTRVLTASGAHGLVDQTDFFNRSVAGGSLDGYYLLKRGDFAYNRSAMKGYPYGAIKRLDEFEEGVLSTLYLCFAPSDDNPCSEFFEHYFECGALNQQLREIVQVGARAHGLLNVTLHDFFSLKILFPPKEEQEKITAHINIAYQELDLLRQKLEALKEQKRGLMQQLLTGKIRVKMQEDKKAARQGKRK